MKNSRSKKCTATVKDSDRQAALDVIYECIALLVPTTAKGIRRAALRHAKRMKSNNATISAITQIDLDLPSQNLVGLMCAWVAMDLNDTAAEGGIGALVANFVDVMNDPANAQGISKQNLALILRVARDLGAHLLDASLGGRAAEKSERGVLEA